MKTLLGCWVVRSHTDEVDLMQVLVALSVVGYILGSHHRLPWKHREEEGVYHTMKQVVEEEVVVVAGVVLHRNKVQRETL